MVPIDSSREVGSLAHERYGFLFVGVFIGESYAVNRAGVGQGPQFFVARFRGLIDGGSDKVPAMVVPEPAHGHSCWRAEVR